MHEIQIVTNFGIFKSKSQGPFRESLMLSASENIVFDCRVTKQSAHFDL